MIYRLCFKSVCKNDGVIFDLRMGEKEHDIVDLSKELHKGWIIITRLTETKLNQELSKPISGLCSISITP